MGILLKILKPEHETQSTPDFVDFENAKPTEAEMEVYKTMLPIIERIPIILDMIKTYSGAADSIRKCIGNPQNVQLMEETWTMLQPLLEKLKKFYEFSQDINKLFPTLLKSLCGTGNAVVQFETRAALAKMFAEIIDFTIRFDEMKMVNPNIQNDLSYYRRVLSNGKTSQNEDNVIINRDLANKMSIFLADPTPFMSILSQTVVKYFTNEQIPTTRDATACFATMIRLCKYILVTPSVSSRFKSKDTLTFCLRVMVGLIILYDHVDVVGAFSKNSSIDVKSCIKVIKDSADGDASGLLNSLRYTSKHFNDDSTPNAVKVMLHNAGS